MARKTSYGKFILSAGEIGSFTVCPEAWRLRVLEKKRRITDTGEVVGIKLHDDWARGHEEVIFLTKGVRIVIFMILLLLAWFHFT